MHRCGAETTERPDGNILTLPKPILGAGSWQARHRCVRLQLDTLDRLARLQLAVLDKSRRTRASTAVLLSSPLAPFPWARRAFRHLATVKQIQTTLTRAAGNNRNNMPLFASCAPASGPCPMLAARPRHQKTHNPAKQIQAPTNDIQTMSETHHTPASGSLPTLVDRLHHQTPLYPPDT